MRACYGEILIDQKQEAINVGQGQILTLLILIVFLSTAENFQASETERFNYT